MNITNEKDVMIYKNDYGKYSVIISKKNADGSFEKAYMPIQFNKGVELENKTLIKIKNAWLSFYKVEDKTKFFIRCSDFDKVEKEENPFKEFGNNLKSDFDVGEQIQIQDEDLPF